MGNEPQTVSAIAAPPRPNSWTARKGPPRPKGTACNRCTSFNDQITCNGESPTCKACVRLARFTGVKETPCSYGPKAKLRSHVLKEKDDFPHQPLVSSLVGSEPTSSEDTAYDPFSPGLPICTVEQQPFVTSPIVEVDFLSQWTMPFASFDAPPTPSRAYSPYATPFSSPGVSPTALPRTPAPAPLVNLNSSDHCQCCQHNQKRQAAADSAFFIHPENMHVDPMLGFFANPGATLNPLQ